VSEQRVRVGEVELAYDQIGDPEQPALLLVMGLGMQLIHWDAGLCEQLAARGFRVIRFDNRDAGLSTKIDAPPPKVAQLLTGRGFEPPYLLSDMAGDALGLLDHLGIERAHVAGVSMGGMICQQMAIDAPERVESLASIMSTTGERRAGRPKLRALGVLMRRAPSGKDAYVEYFVRTFRTIGSPGFPVDEARMREVAALTYERGHHPAGTARQLAAIVASGDRSARLRELRVPTVVIHGRRDPLIPFRGGVATARAIPGAELHAIDGMGHDLPPAVWPRVVEAIAGNAARAADRAAA
jgi:pimeloyl-ACP methyl ester carboxylesterase